MIQQIRSTELRNFAAGLTVLLIGLVLVWLLPAPDAAKGLASYVPLHTIMETVAIAMAAMVFGVSWATQKLDQTAGLLCLASRF
jgi:hypothetical protein